MSCIRFDLHMQHQLDPDKWVSNYADYLFSYASYRINDTLQAEDLVQETFLSAFKAINAYKGEASEKTWLTSILKNKIIDLYRKNAREAKVVVPISDYTYFFADEENPHWTAQAVPREMSVSGLAKLEQQEMSKIISDCLALLPTTWNQISKMKLIEQEKTETICKVFDITPSNFWVIMHRAKLQLRDCIDKKWNHA